MRSKSQIFISCLNGWHCSNSELLPRCKSIHLGWQDGLTHQQLEGRISETLSGKQIPILGHPPNSGRCLSWASLAFQKHLFLKKKKREKKRLALDCFVLRPPPGRNSCTFAQKHIHTDKPCCDSCPWSHFQSVMGITYSRTNKSEEEAIYTDKKMVPDFWKETACLKGNKMAGMLLRKIKWRARR